MPHCRFPPFPASPCDLCGFQQGNWKQKPILQAVEVFEAFFTPHFKCLSPLLGTAVPLLWQPGGNGQIKLPMSRFHCCGSTAWSKGKGVVSIIKPVKTQKQNPVGIWIPETD